MPVPAAVSTAAGAAGAAGDGSRRLANRSPPAVSPAPRRTPPSTAGQREPAGEEASVGRSPSLAVARAATSGGVAPAGAAGSPAGGTTAAGAGPVADGAAAAVVMDPAAGDGAPAVGARSAAPSPTAVVLPRAGVTAGRYRRKRSALLTTVTELSAMAAAAIVGLRRILKGG